MLATIVCNSFGQCSWQTIHVGAYLGRAGIGVLFLSEAMVADGGKGRWHKPLVTIRRSHMILRSLAHPPCMMRECYARWGDSSMTALHRGSLASLSVVFLALQWTSAAVAEPDWMTAMKRRRLCDG